MREPRLMRSPHARHEDVINWATQQLSTSAAF